MITNHRSRFAAGFAVAIAAPALVLSSLSGAAWADSPGQDEEVVSQAASDSGFAESFNLHALDVSDDEAEGYGDYPGGKGKYPGGGNKAEFKYCIKPKNRQRCKMAKVAAEESFTRTGNRFPRNTLYQGVGDAYRHCYWSARMTIEMGPAVAKGFGDRHEAYSKGADKEMDLVNNAIGRGIGSKTRYRDIASNKCEALARSGDLMTIR